MPTTSFTTVNNGDPLNPAQVNQFAAPINALETAVDALASPALSDVSDWPAGVSATEVGYLDGVTSGIQAQLDGKAASSHNHAASDINSGQLALANGGTGANLSATGGAGQVLKQASTGAAITVGVLAASDIPSGVDATKIGTGSVSNTEFGYLDGVTSALQTQLDGKAASSHTHSASAITSGVLDKAQLGLTTNGDLLTVIGGVLSRLGVSGSDGYVLTRQSGLPTWAPPSGGGGSIPASSGSDGDVTVSGSVTLTRDMYYNNLTIASGGALNPAQYQIFVAGTLAQTGGKISANGSQGGAGTGTSGGSAGGVRPAGTLGLSGAGTAGAPGGTGAGATSSAATGGSAQSWGGRGASSINGGSGGTGSSGAGGSTGAPGAYTHVSPRERVESAPKNDGETFLNIRGGAGGTGGGAGGGDGSNSSRGGGGGGGGGGVCLVFVNHLDLSGASGVLIESIGGAGGNAATGSLGNCGGSGGGQGGGGGYVGLYCNSVTGSLSNAIDVSGGTGGNGSDGAGTGTGGRGGRGGDGGNADFYRADTGAWTRARSAGSASGTAAAAPSGVSGTTGGAGEVVRLSI